MRGVIEMEFRKMLPADYGECRAIWESSPGVRIVTADSPESVDAFLERNPGMSFVCTEEGEIVGTALCGHDGRRGFLYHVAVKPEYRGRRIGTGLVESCLGMLNAAGIDKCHVFVLTDNEVGNAFWGSSWMKREDILVYSKNT